MGLESGPPSRLEPRSNQVFPAFTILFWGFVAAVLGFLGQCAGLYNALVAIADATEYNSKVIAQGFAESFAPTLWGGALLLIAAISWMVLRRAHR